MNRGRPHLAAHLILDARPRRPDIAWDGSATPRAPEE
ncbi:hypothetical protein GGR88_000531 [Sphingomonas jejuensis]|uniref:Uncharacterized protein n=1 Tax=Sphingomonas jejuensis TaxID=904715 RepID=A0ABX0XI96_9SPHN|nr:hypothetical protein [Sphingomonas jejuensis]